MKKILPFFIVLLQTINAFAQIEFEKGYYIDKSGNRIECYLRNNDLQNAPEAIKYKLHEESGIKTLDIKDVVEFSTYNTYRFIKRTVRIGKADELNGKEKDYTFKSEELFLKVIVEGKATLCSYNEKGIETFFFYTSSILEPQQLVFKTYRVENLKAVQENRNYRKQLFDNLKCEAINFDDAINLEYEKKDLIKFFVKYNKCENSNSTVYVKKQKTFNINIRPRISNVSLTLQERGNQVTLDSYDFGNKSIFGIGIEAEMILPFLNNKWAVSVEPTYQKYNSEITTQMIGNAKETFKVDYSSLEMPLTLRHYSFINSNSKIFLNASMVFDFSNKSSIEKKLNDILLDDIEIAPNLNFAYGAGYKFKNKYNVELRFYTKRNLVNQLIDWTSSYNSTSIILGYTLF